MTPVVSKAETVAGAGRAGTHGNSLAFAMGNQPKNANIFAEHGALRVE